MNLIPEIEFQSPERIRILQQSLFGEALAYARQHSPYYKRTLQHYPLVTTLEDIRSLPVTTKDDLQQYNNEFLAVPKNQIAEYTSTSGTLGKPVTVGLTRKDIDRLAHNEFISFVCADGTADDLYQLMVTLDRQFMAGLAYYEGVRTLGAGLIRVGPGLPALQWETIHRLKPTVVVSVPSFLIRLIEYAEANGIDVNGSSVKRAICIGENIRTESLEPNALARRIANAWTIKLYGTYASTEMQTAFTECSQGAGGHHHPELVYVELLDEQNNPVADGTHGEVTITTFGVEGMPLVRYKTGDMARAFYERCLCGRTTLRLGPVAGRKQQMIKLKGTTVYPQGVFEILNQEPRIANYVVEAAADSFGSDELRLYLLVPEGHQKPVVESLRTAFQSRLRVVPAMVFKTAQELEILQLSGNGRKLTKFIDRRTSV